MYLRAAVLRLDQNLNYNVVLAKSKLENNVNYSREHSEFETLSFVSVRIFVKPRRRTEKKSFLYTVRRASVPPRYLGIK